MTSKPAMFHPYAPANRTAAEAYAERREQILSLLERIKLGVDEHAPPDERLDWGHVGDLGYVAASLQDIADFLRGEGEYAK